MGNKKIDVTRKPLADYIFLTIKYGPALEAVRCKSLDYGRKNIRRCSGPTRTNAFLKAVTLVVAKTAPIIR
jgi:hypothetical protein